MSLHAPITGQIALLKYMLNNATPTDVKIHLYTNNVTINDSTILSNIVESSASGYSAQNLFGVSWTVQNVSGTTAATYNSTTFTFNASDSIVGYYITDSISTNCLWLEAFPAPFTLPGGGGNVIINPRITLGNVS